jgi:hypothetical protein
MGNFIPSSYADLYFLCRICSKECGGKAYGPINGLERVSMTGCNSADGWKNGGVNRTSLIKECANDVLRAFDAFLGGWGCSVCHNSLHPCPKLDWGSLVWCTLWLQQSWVLVFEECLGDIPLKNSNKF